LSPEADEPAQHPDLAPQVSVVLPTYCEAESLPVIVPAILDQLARAGLRAEVVVVDDDSPDGTEAVALQLAQHYPLRVERRRGVRGLATAVLRGIALARSPICVVMDADGSHPVSALPAMVRLIAEDKADVVVGSRHVPGGGSRDWPLSAQLKSQLASALAFGLTSMTDPTTGLMAVKRELVQKLVAADALDPVGWKIVLEIVVKGAPVRVAEVPIVFEDRALGQSKQSLRVYAQYLAHLTKLYGHRFPTLQQLLLFCLVGLSGLIVDLSVVALAKELWALDTRLCAVLGFSAAVTTNYVQNRRFTFSAARELPALWSYLTYVGANLLGLSVRMLVVHTLIVAAGVDAGYGYLASNALGIALATLVNFFGAKYLAFDPARFEPPASVPATSSAVARKPNASTVSEQRALPTALARAMAAVLVCACALTFVLSTTRRELVIDNEGVNVTMAYNALADGTKLLRPSVFPGGRADWVHEDLPALGNTPFHTALLAPFAAVAGLPGMGALPWLSLWAAVAATALMLAQGVGRRAGLYAALLLGTSPAFLSRASGLEMEPTLTALCAGGLLCFVRGVRAQNRRLSALGGALLGLGFLTKMWLIAPYALAACGFVLVEATLVRARADAPLRLRRSLIAAALGFAATAGLHLLSVLVLSPADFGRWLSHVYLGLFSGQGVTAAKLGGAADQPSQPAFYYLALLYRDAFYLLPLVLFGLPAMLRRARSESMAVLAMAFGAGAGVVLLSVPAAKEPLYVLSVQPLLYALAATALAEVEHDDPRHRIPNAAAAYAASAVALLATLGSFLFALDVRLSGLPYPALHAAGTLAACGVAMLVVRNRTSTAGGSVQAGLLLTGACAAAVGGYAAVALHEPRPTPERMLAEALRAELEHAQPAYPAFVAPHARVLMGMLAQAGTDWPRDAPCAPPDDPRISVIVLGPAQHAARCATHALRRRLSAARELALPEVAAQRYRAFVLPH
jgi:dolichol-phosphate mannosyltransferase